MGFHILGSLGASIIEWDYINKKCALGMMESFTRKIGLAIPLQDPKKISS